MPSGVKIKEMTVGTGMVAERGKVVVVHIRGFLHRGEECLNTYQQGQPERIDLSGRESIAGLRKGIEGMRVGGRRELIVSPHLAYRAKGLIGRIPPNAVIRFEVELLDVREAGVVHPDDYLSGKQLMVFPPGEAMRNLPRWQFGLQEGASAGATITYPLPGLTWRHARVRHVEIKLDPAEMAEVIMSAQAIPAEFPKECLQNDDLWADASEKANSVTRNKTTNAPCVTITISEKDRILLNYALPETSPALTGSKFFKIISRELAPYLAAEG
jgi:hypothetical protein